MRNILISLFVIFSQLAFGGTSFDMTSPIPVVKNLKEGLADLGDVKLWYQDTGGQGEAIVFFHPGSGSFEFYPFQQIGLAEKGYRVITYSRRGNYKSEIGSQPEQSFASDDFIHLLDFLKIKSAHIVGSAAGGFAALDVALTYPERVHSLVLSSSLMGLEEENVNNILGGLRPKAFRSLPTDFQELSPSYRAANPKGTAEWNLRHSRARLARVMQKKHGHATWKNLAKMTVPVLLLTGSADLYMPPYVLKNIIAPNIPKSRVIIIQEAGHAAHWE